MKAFADDKINVTEKLKFVLANTENILGNGKNFGYQHFLLFPLCFENAFFFQGLSGKVLTLYQKKNV